jgi:hypothetical protein
MSAAKPPLSTSPVTANRTVSPRMPGVSRASVTCECSHAANRIRSIPISPPSAAVAGSMPRTPRSRRRGHVARTTVQTRCVPEVATELLQVGYDTPTLRVAAGLLSPQLDEAHELFGRALAERTSAAASRRLARRYYVATFASCLSLLLFSLSLAQTGAALVRSGSVSHTSAWYWRVDT